MKTSIKSTNTYAARPEDITEKWYIIDAADQKIGRVASKIAELLLGKNDPKIAAAKHMAPSANVIVINSDKLDVAFKKAEQKVYTSYSGYPGGLKSMTLGEMMQHKSQNVITHAVKGMLPKNRRGREIAAHLYVYADADYVQTAQQPQTVNLSN
jgi:large subunit ribosomal protein L13